LTGNPGREDMSRLATSLISFVLIGALGGGCRPVDLQQQDFEERPVIIVENGGSIDAHFDSKNDSKKVWKDKHRNDKTVARYEQFVPRGYETGSFDVTDESHKCDTSGQIVVVTAKTSVYSFHVEIHSTTNDPNHVDLVFAKGTDIERKNGQQHRKLHFKDADEIASIRVDGQDSCTPQGKVSIKPVRK
jgi:hypothetical protein